MMRVTIAEPRDYDAILRLWASALPVDWIGRERFYTGLLCDPAFRDDSLWVAKTRGRHVVGFALISAPTTQGRKMGAIAVEAAYRGQGIGTRLWHAVCATVNPAESLRVDGIFHMCLFPEWIARIMPPRGNGFYGEDANRNTLLWRWNGSWTIRLSNRKLPCRKNWRQTFMSAFSHAGFVIEHWKPRGPLAPDGNAPCGKRGSMHAGPNGC